MLSKCWPTLCTKRQLYKGSPIVFMLSAINKKLQHAIKPIILLKTPSTGYSTENTKYCMPGKLILLRKIT